MSLDIAIIGGLIGTIAAVLFLQVWEVARPSPRQHSDRHHHWLGFHVHTLRANNFTGAFFLFLVGICYGIFTSAVIYAFESEAIGWLVGPVRLRAVMGVDRSNADIFPYLASEDSKRRNQSPRSICSRLYTTERGHVTRRAPDLWDRLRRGLRHDRLITQKRCHRMRT